MTRSIVRLRNPNEKIEIAEGREFTGFTLERDTWITLAGPNGRIRSIPRDRVVDVDTFGWTQGHDGQSHDPKGAH